MDHTGHSANADYPPEPNQEHELCPRSAPESTRHTKAKYRVSNSLNMTEPSSIAAFSRSGSPVPQSNIGMPIQPRSAAVQTKYSDLVIETALTLGLVFHLPLRQTEGFIASIFALMGLPFRRARSHHSFTTQQITRHQSSCAKDQRPDRLDHR